MKICCKCKEEKELSCFYRSARSEHKGYRRECKACELVRLKLWLKSHPQKKAPQDRAKIRAYEIIWRARNKGKISEKDSLYREKNKANILIKAATDHAKRRAAMLNAVPRWADLKAVRAIYAEARRLTRETGIQHHVDHCVPLKHKLVRGLHNEFNLQVMTGSENMSKGNRTWSDMP